MEKKSRWFINGGLRLIVAAGMAGAVWAAAPLNCSQKNVGITATGTMASKAAEKSASGNHLLIAQKKESVPETSTSAPAPAAEPEKIRPAEVPAPQMERSRKAIKRGEDLERAGTRKIGGEVIRNKDE